MFQMGGVGPMLGQNHTSDLRAREDCLRHRPLHQRGAAPVRRDRQAPGGHRQLDRRGRIFDCRHGHLPLAQLEEPGHGLEDFPALKAWFETIAARPAVQRALAVLADRRKPLHDDKARAVLFAPSNTKR